MQTFSDIVGGLGYSVERLMAGYAAVFHHGTLFHNEEICTVYLLEADVEPVCLPPQTEEVSEGAWFDLTYVSARMEARDPLFCTDGEKFRRIAAVLHTL